MVAMCQPCPVLQIGSGILAVFSSSQLFGLSLSGRGPAELGAFVVTLLTAMPLLLTSFVVGGGHRLILGTEDDSGADPEATSEE